MNVGQLRDRLARVADEAEIIVQLDADIAPPPYRIVEVEAEPARWLAGGAKSGAGLVWLTIDED